MDQYPKIPKRKRAQLTPKELFVLVLDCFGVSKTEELTFMEVDLETR